jgi:flavin-dependent dehydrogenase
MAYLAMNSNPADIERAEFSQRLIASLMASGHEISPTALAKEFNIRSREKTRDGEWNSKMVIGRVDTESISLKATSNNRTFS